jgi:hypothetical protein
MTIPLTDPFTTFVIRCLISCFLFIPSIFCKAQSVSDTIKDESFVTFFKNTLCKPPDIAHFSCSFRLLNVPAGYAAENTNVPHLYQWQYFEGARSGSNFFLRFLPSATATNATSTIGIRTIGQAGTKNYQVLDESVTYGYGTNKVQQSLSSTYKIVWQCLNLGVTTVKSESIVWKGKQFQGTCSIDEKPILGDLEVLDGRPQSLKLTKNGSPHPYKVYLYTYPDPPLSLGGYPAKIQTLSILAKDQEPSPLSEWNISSLILASQPLTTSFFEDAYFHGPRIHGTNIYSNEVFQTHAINGKQMVISLKPVSNDKLVWKRSIILSVCLLVLVIGPLLIYRRNIK